MQELSKKYPKLMSLMYKALFPLSFLPHIWKVVKTIIILKPGEQPTEVALYRPTVNIFLVLATARNNAFYKPVVYKDIGYYDETNIMTKNGLKFESYYLL